jgi:S-(hydroxymethyl)glutathione dehydrogenase/alcohol dehydrogenase
MYDFMSPLVIEEIDVKEPRHDEVLVKIAASGICRTDLSVIRCHLPFPPPVVLGHEAAGVVEAVGSSVKQLQVGDHIVPSGIVNCGSCHYCKIGEGHLCTAGVESAVAGEEFVFEKDGLDIARFAGIGSFAEKTVIKATACVKIPDDMPLNRACLLGCAVVTGVGAVINTAKVRAGQTVAVLGCGGVGLNIIQGAVISGAGRIVAVDMNDSKLESAQSFGATHLVNPDNVPDVAEAIKDATDGLGVDYAFEAIGIPDVVAQAFMALKRGGKVIVVGVPGFGVDFVLPGCLFSLEERSVIGSLFGSTNMQRDVPRFIDLYKQRRLRLDELVTQEIGIEDVNDAFEAMEKGDVIRSVIVYD